MIYILISGFGDLVPLANVQRSGQSLYSRWGYFIFTVSFILFGLAIMASSLNLLVLRLAQFHSENGTGGVSALLGRNEQELIAAAIAHHRASIHTQHLNRLCTNNANLCLQPKSNQLYLPMRTPSWYTGSSSPSSSSSSLHETSRFELEKNSQNKSCSSFLGLIGCHKRKRRHWHLRRSPQNIKHLLDFEHFIENSTLRPAQKNRIPLQFQQQYVSNHLSRTTISGKQQRISI